LNNVAIAAGSNLGDRRSHLEYAVDRLSAVLGGLTVSPFYETAPVGVTAQPEFLNGAMVGVTALSARSLLDTLLAIERERGRERPFPGAPRTLDLDLILVGTLVVDEPGLTVPHPRFRTRLFVLQPLADIAAHWVDPMTRKSIGELAAECRAASGQPLRPFGRA
jgi:2-amino-4-hydroxy-6-hydroxymethyldihydropteridine diphosphokinase